MPNQRSVDIDSAVIVVDIDVLLYWSQCRKAVWYVMWFSNLSNRNFAPIVFIALLCACVCVSVSRREGFKCVDRRTQATSKFVRQPKINSDNHVRITTKIVQRQ